MNIREILNEYREATINFINIIEEDYSKAEYFIELREQCLEKLKSLNIDKEELRSIYNGLNIIEIDKEASKMLILEKDTINNEIIKLKKNKEASQVYNSAFKNINFINKKI